MILLAFKFYLLAAIKTSTTTPKPFTRSSSESRVTGPSDSPFLEDHPDMQRRAAATSVDRYFPVEAAAADSERTRRTNNFCSSFS